MSIRARSAVPVVAAGFLGAALVWPSLHSVASADDTMAPNPLRTAFGLPAAPSGIPVENEYGLTLNAGELARLRAADAAVERMLDLAGRLEQTPAQFGGVWFDRTTDTVRIELVRPTAATWELAHDADLGARILVSEVNHTLAELNALQVEVNTWVDPRFISLMGVDIPTNQLQIGLSAGAPFALADDLRARYGDRVLVVAPREAATNNVCSDRARCAPPFKGGLDIWRQDSVPCSSGFVYDNAYTASGSPKGKVLTTAGHCSVTLSQTGAYWFTSNLTVGQVFRNDNRNQTNADVMFIDIDNATDSNDVYISYINMRDMLYRQCASEFSGSKCEAIGGTVCYSGRTTGYICSTLKRVNVQATDDDGFVKYHNRVATFNPTQGGDSGAPVFNQNKAMGHFWGGGIDNDGQPIWLYSHIHYVQQYCSNGGNVCRVQIVD